MTAPATDIPLPQSAGAQEQASAFAIWPAGTPGVDPAAREEEFEPGKYRNVRNPALLVYELPAERRCRTAVIVCPGGGYGMVSCVNEGFPVAKWLNRLGICAYVLKYRLPGTPGGAYRHPVPLSDVQRAVRLIRGSAAGRGLRADRIGILGFSAGGHLAATALTGFAEPVQADAVSCRPDFGLLVYPVVSFVDDTCCHAGSRNNLLGPDADPALRRRLSPEHRVTGRTPPVFLAHARNDGAVPFRNSVLLHEALKAHGVRTALHLFEQGGHGFGLGQPHQDASGWPLAAADWLRELALL